VTTTLVCDVQRRSPIAVIALYGTLDQNSVVRAVVALRDCLADAPAAMLIDIGHLRIANQTSLRPVIGLFDEIRAWPRTHIGICAASPANEAMFATESPTLYADVDAGMIAALTLPVVPRKTIALAPDADAPAVARDFVTATCSDWGLTRVAKLATLIASELVTNAVIHARTPAVMALQRTASELHVSVQDNDPRPMYRPAPGATGAHNGDHGRGLLILDAMADGWGTLPTATGKVVWATVEFRD
jgi:histidine kinase-like protein